MMATYFNITLVCLYTIANSYSQFIFYGASFFVLVPQFGLNITWTSAIAYLTTILNIFLSVAVGFYSDRTLSKFGPRKPFIVVGFLLVSVAFILLAQLGIPLAELFSTPAENQYSRPDSESVEAVSSNQLALEMWFAVYEMIGAIGFGLYTIPYIALYQDACEESNDYAAFELYCFNIGTAVGSIGGLLTLSYVPSKALLLSAIVFIGVAGPLLVAVLVSIPSFSEITRGHTCDSIESKPQTQGKSWVSTSTLLLLPALRVFFESEDFRDLFFNNVVLQVGEGLGTEFVTFAAYILFPAFTHYRQLLVLATQFFLVNYCMSTVLTFLAAYYLSREKADKLQLYFYIIFTFVFVCIVEFILCIPGLLVTLGATSLLPRELQAGVHDQKSDVSLALVYSYLALQILLSAIFTIAKIINDLMVRDLIRLDRVMIGQSRASLYQAALGVPTRVLVVFFIALPQVLFYSTGYKVLSPSWAVDTDDDQANNSTTTFVGLGIRQSDGDDAYEDDDLIANKYSWTAASFFEIFLIQNVIAGLLAYLSYRIMRRYSITQDVADQVDLVYEALVSEDTQQQHAGTEAYGMRGSQAGITTQTSDDSNSSTYMSLSHSASSPGPVTPPASGMGSLGATDLVDFSASSRSGAGADTNTSFRTRQEQDYEPAKLPYFSIMENPLHDAWTHFYKLTPTQKALVCMSFSAHERFRLLEMWRDPGLNHEAGVCEFGKMEVESGAEAASITVGARGGDRSGDKINHDTHTEGPQSPNNQFETSNSFSHAVSPRGEVETGEWVETINPLSQVPRSMSPLAALSGGWDDTGSCANGGKTALSYKQNDHQAHFAPWYMLRLHALHWASLYVVAPILIAAMIAGLYYQVEANTVFTPLAANLLSLCCCYALYDLMRIFAVSKVKDIALSSLTLSPHDKAKGGAGKERSGGRDIWYVYDPSDDLDKGGTDEDLSHDEYSNRFEVAGVDTGSSKSLDSAALLASRHRSHSRLSRQKTVDIRTADSVHLTEALQEAGHIQTTSDDVEGRPGPGDVTPPSHSRYSISLSYLSQVSGSSRNSRYLSNATEGGERKRAVDAMAARESDRDRRRKRRIAVRNLMALRRTLLALSHNEQDDRGGAGQDSELNEIRRVVEAVSVHNALKHGILSRDHSTDRGGAGANDAEPGLDGDDADVELSRVQTATEQETLLPRLSRWLACEPRGTNKLSQYKSYQPWLAFVPYLLFVTVMLTVATLFVAVIR